MGKGVTPHIQEGEMKGDNPARGIIPPQTLNLKPCTREGERQGDNRSFIQAVPP